MKMYTHWAPLAHSFLYVSKTFSGPEIGASVEHPPANESSHRGDDACDCIVYIFCIFVYVEYFFMYICIYVYILKRNYAGFDPQWTRYVGGRLKSGSSPIFLSNYAWN